MLYQRSTQALKQSQDDFDQFLELTPDSIKSKVKQVFFWKVIRKNHTIIKFFEKSGDVDLKTRNAMSFFLKEAKALKRSMSLKFQDSYVEPLNKIDRFGQDLVSKLGILLTMPEEVVVA